MPATPPDKICRRCGRPFAWRKRWARDWDTVVYCSAACRRGRLGPLDEALEAAILDLLGRRAAHATICPSEAARAVRPDDWRPLMERTRQAARRLAHAERIVITQRGKVVDPGRFRGPIRLRLV